MNKRGCLILATCLAGGLSLAQLGCEGSNDCNDSEAIGTWRTDSVEPTTGYKSSVFRREELTFASDCTVLSRVDYSGFYADEGSELRLFFGEGKERTAELDGDSMTMITHEDDSEDEYTLKLTRSSSANPDSGPSGKCCQCRCRGCGHEQKIPRNAGCMDDCQNLCKTIPGCDPDPEQADDISC